MKALDIISKALLSEVLGRECTSFVIRSNIITYNCKVFGLQGYKFSKVVETINIYELAHKCKEWAYAEGYCIRTFQSAIGWVVDLIHEDRTKTQSQYSRKDNINGQLYIEIFPRETEATIHPKHFNIELDAIFKACQWLLDNKDRL